MILYLDESGDLGFDFEKKGTSRFFVITILVCDNSEVARGFKKAVRRTLAKKVWKRRGPKKHAHELKGTHTELKVKNYFLRQIPVSGWRLYSAVLNKARVFPHLRTKLGKTRLYNFFAKFLLEQIEFPNDLTSVHLVVDRCKTNQEIKDFNRYVADNLGIRLSVKTLLHVAHDASQENPGLQAADLFCWGVFRKHERQDDAWHKTYEQHMAYEDIYLPE